MSDPSKGQKKRRDGYWGGPQGLRVRLYHHMPPAKPHQQDPLCCREKSRCLGVRRAGSRPRSRPLLAVMFLNSYITNLTLSFLIWKVTHSFYLMRVLRSR